MTETTVKERPILFSGEMVRAILDGRKTQTRRIVKYKDPFVHMPSVVKVEKFEKNPQLWEFTDELSHDDVIACPYGIPGDRLWVRETCIISPPNFCDQDSDLYNVTDREGNGRLCQYVATHPDTDIPVVDYKLKVTPSIHMPRWASRITLEITDVRVQRLQEISEEDAIAEGCQCAGVPASLTNRGAFAKLWNSINGDGSWESNSWVWAVSFHKLETEQ